VIEERIEVPDMIGKPYSMSGFPDWPNPMRSGATQCAHRRNQRKDISPYVRRCRLFEHTLF
jgi:hypothetical protein